MASRNKKDHNHIVIENGVAYMHLERGPKPVELDAADVAIVIPYLWYAIRGRKNRTWYAVSRPAHRGPLLYMHRLILGLPDELEVDHRDGDGLHNRRQNLRPATHSQNQANTCGPRCDNALGLKGVYRRGCRFRAQIRHNGKLITLGTFPTAELAAAAYNEGAIRIFGEFAGTSQRQ